MVKTRPMTSQEIIWLEQQQAKEQWEEIKRLVDVIGKGKVINLLQVKAG
jgi:hypothetical protein